MSDGPMLGLREIALRRPRRQFRSALNFTEPVRNSGRSVSWLQLAILIGCEQRKLNPANTTSKD
jgi:hypothetical protein